MLHQNIDNNDTNETPIKDEDEKEDFMDVISKVDIKIDTTPVIEGNEFCYNIWIRERNTKRRKHFQLCRLEFLKREKMETIPNLIDILNELRRWLDLPDDCRESYEILPKESANKYSMLPIDWKRLFS